MAAARSFYALVGASGFIGKATVAGLAKAVGGDRVVVATRNTASAAADSYRALGANVVTGDLNAPDALVPVFRGASAAYVIAPGSEDRADLSVNGIKAAKEAGVPFIVVLSVSAVGLKPDILFGRQFTPVEAAVKDTGIPYTILRLPIFTDNLWGQADTIKSIGKFFGPVNPDVPHHSVAVQDAADAAVAVLTNPAAHTNKTYSLLGPVYTYAEQARIISEALGKPVDYVQVPYEAALESFVSKGWPEWQVKGLLELFRAEDDGTFNVTNDDIKTILGREPTSVKAWFEAVKGGFA